MISPANVISKQLSSNSNEEKRKYHPEGPAVTLVGEPQGPEIKIRDEQESNRRSPKADATEDRESSPEKYKKYIDNYKILKDLGEGTFGKVKLGVDMRT